MAWIESHQELCRHPKTIKFARILGVCVPQAIGHLQCLWWWAMDFAPNGDISQFDAEEIAYAMMWTDNSKTLMDALITTRFIDSEDGCTYIHDWMDYAGKLVERREKDRERKNSFNGIPTDSAGKRKDSDGNRTETLVTVPIPYLNSTLPLDTTPSNPPAGKDEEEEAEETEQKSGIEPVGAEETAPRSEVVPYEEIMSEFNSVCTRMPKIQGIDGTRAKSVAAIFKSYGIEKIKAMYDIASISNFLCGVNDRNWKADFDWLMKPKNFLKVLEHGYQNKSKAPPGNSSFDNDEFFDAAIAASQRKMSDTG